MSELSVVDLTTCRSLANTDKPFILVLHKDEDLFQGILQAATEMNLSSASVSGLGALKEVTLAFYLLEKQTYQTQLFSPDHELVSLNGNITVVDGKPFLHVHAALGKEDYQVMGGHVMSATVAVTAEITIIPLKNKIYRELNTEVGLKTICAIK